MKENYILFSFNDNDKLASTLSNTLSVERGSVEIRQFPDGESYIRINSNVKDKTVLLICRLDHPNTNILPLMFMAETLKALGAKHIMLISPYLPYMRQDKRFNPGEGTTAFLFAKYLSRVIDSLITIDPHLHRIQHLSEIYFINSISVLHASKKMAEWIGRHVESPFIIGPDEESKQWVAEVAEIVNASYAIIKKKRHGDREVTITLPDINEINKTVVLVDDIISTGSTMLASIKELKARGFKKPICIGVHALFDDVTHDHLIQAGAQEVITCNTILHPSNKIDISDTIVEELKRVILNTGN